MSTTWCRWSNRALARYDTCSYHACSTPHVNLLVLYVFLQRTARIMLCHHGSTGGTLVAFQNVSVALSSADLSSMQRMVHSMQTKSVVAPPHRMSDFEFCPQHLRVNQSSVNYSFFQFSSVSILTKHRSILCNHHRFCRVNCYNIQQYLDKKRLKVDFVGKPDRKRLVAKVRIVSLIGWRGESVAVPSQTLTV